MSIYWWFLVIFLTALAVMLGTAWLTGRGERIPRPADPAPLPSTMTRALPRAGRFDADWWPDPGAGFISRNDGTHIEWRGHAPFDLLDALAAVYGPFPADTGPLLILSEKMAANVALEREIRQRCVEAEAKIPPRWR